MYFLNGTKKHFERCDELVKFFNIFDKNPILKTFARRLSFVSSIISNLFVQTMSSYLLYHSLKWQVMLLLDKDIFKFTKCYLSITKTLLKHKKVLMYYFIETRPINLDISNPTLNWICINCNNWNSKFEWKWSSVINLIYSEQ
jgi:hypothetical protein